MADVPRSRETASVSVDKYSPRPDLKETTHAANLCLLTHLPTCPQHLVGTAAAAAAEDAAEGPLKAQTGTLYVIYALKSSIMCVKRIHQG